MINLLPIEFQKKQQHRRLMIILTAVQLFVFLLLGATVLYMHGREQYAALRSAELTERLAHMDRTPVYLAEAVLEMERNQRMVEHYIADNLPLIFNPCQLAAIIDIAAPGTQVRALEFMGAYMVLNAVADDMGYISNHRRRLADIFYPVVLGRMERLADGRVGYELRIHITE